MTVKAGKAPCVLLRAVKKAGLPAEGGGFCKNAGFFAVGYAAFKTHGHDNGGFSPPPCGGDRRNAARLFFPEVLRQICPVFVNAGSAR